MDHRVVTYRMPMPMCSTDDSDDETLSNSSSSRAVQSSNTPSLLKPAPADTLLAPGYRRRKRPAPNPFIIRKASDAAAAAVRALVSHARKLDLEEDTAMEMDVSAEPPTPVVLDAHARLKAAIAQAKEENALTEEQEAEKSAQIAKARAERRNRDARRARALRQMLENQDTDGDTEMAEVTTASNHNPETKAEDGTCMQKWQGQMLLQRMINDRREVRKAHRAIEKRDDEEEDARYHEEEDSDSETIAADTAVNNGGGDQNFIQDVERSLTREELHQAEDEAWLEAESKIKTLRPEPKVKTSEPASKKRARNEKAAEVKLQQVAKRRKRMSDT